MEALELIREFVTPPTSRRERQARWMHAGFQYYFWLVFHGLAHLPNQPRPDEEAA